MMWKTWPRTRRKWRKPGQDWTNSIRIIYSVVLAAWISAQEAKSTQCPPPETIPGCPCYNFEDGLFLECAGATEDSLKITLSGVVKAAGSKGTVYHIK